MKLPGRIASVDIIESRDLTPHATSSYLHLHELTMQTRYNDGTRSAPYRYEGVTRKHLDAVVVVLVAVVDDVPHVCLRTCIRPPLLMRERLDLPQPDPTRLFALLELPAGLIEDGDSGDSGLFERAAAETLEEAGYRVSPSAFAKLGAAPFNTPGVMAERCFYVRADIEDIHSRTSPEGDGSPLEVGGDIVWLPLAEAIAMCDQGEILDMKTELGLRRLA